jgi:hypothetical protein
VSFAANHTSGFAPDAPAAQTSCSSQGTSADHIPAIISYLLSDLSVFSYFDLIQRQQ